jgi:hypothetical protein
MQRRCSRQQGTVGPFKEDWTSPADRYLRWRSRAPRDVTIRPPRRNRRSARAGQGHRVQRPVRATDSILEPFENRARDFCIRLQLRQTPWIAFPIEGASYPELNWLAPNAYLTPNWVIARVVATPSEQRRTGLIVVQCRKSGMISRPRRYGTVLHVAHGFGGASRCVRARFSVVAYGTESGVSVLTHSLLRWRSRTNHGAGAGDPHSIRPLAHQRELFTAKGRGNIEQPNYNGGSPMLEEPGQPLSILPPGCTERWPPGSRRTVGLDGFYIPCRSARSLHHEYHRRERQRLGSGLWSGTTVARKCQGESWS